MLLHEHIQPCYPLHAVFDYVWNVLWLFFCMYAAGVRRLSLLQRPGLSSTISLRCAVSPFPAHIFAARPLLMQVLG